MSNDNSEFADPGQLLAHIRFDDPTKVSTVPNIRKSLLSPHRQLFETRWAARNGGYDSNYVNQIVLLERIDRLNDIIEAKNEIIASMRDELLENYSSG